MYIVCWLLAAKKICFYLFSPFLIHTSVNDRSNISLEVNIFLLYQHNYKKLEVVGFVITFLCYDQIRISGSLLSSTVWSLSLLCGSYGAELSKALCFSVLCSYSR